MLKVKFNLRNVVAVAICLAGVTMFSGCDKNDEEPPKNPLTYDEGVVINGVKWATRNVDEIGTFALTSESAGKFYQWNRKKAWAITGEVTGWDNSSDESTVWEKEKDPSPEGWRVPTSDEIKSLIEETKVNSEWINQNGIIGRKFTDKSNGNSIFFPAFDDGVALRECSGKIGGTGQGAVYWGSTSPSVLIINADGSHSISISACYGFSLRPVSE